MQAALLLAACGPTSPDPEVALSYTGREACGACHADVVEAWTDSDHDRAMDHATPETVLGDFADVTLGRDRAEARLEHRDDRFWIATDAEDGALRDFEVVYTFGARPLQQYLVETEPGRLQRIPWSWDVRPAGEGGQRWFHTYGDDPIAPDDVLHWTRPSQNWNGMCADCHSTNLVKAYDAESDRYATTWSEIDVSCEACHGPASAHLAWAEAVGSADRGFPVRFEGPDDGGWTRAAGEATAHRTVPVSDRQGLEQCASCHAHRTPIAVREAGAPFTDSYRLSLLRAPLYHADGQVREEVFVYGSFLQSRMYREGVTCVSCHDPHTAELRAQGNALCTQCHAAQVFDAPRHHRHEQDTEGATCVECHMPETTFMQVDARRDHGFRIPRPHAEGAPNACTACHERRDAAWVRTTLDTWYGPPADLSRALVAHAFESAERGDPAAVPELRTIATTGDHNPIVRATAVSYLEDFPSPAALDAVRTAATDDDPLVRAQAARALRILQPSDRPALVAPLLDDPSRLVRIAAAGALASVPPDRLSARRLEALGRARAEQDQAFRLNADDPAAAVEAADGLAERGMPHEAELEYRRAIALEPTFAPAYLNLADLYRATGREREAREVLEAGRSRAPDAAVLAYALGLLHVRAGRTAEAVAVLDDASALDPSDPRYVVALALTLQRAGRPADAVDALREAAAQDRPPRDVLAALVAVHRAQGATGRALEVAERLASLYPGRNAAALLAEIRAGDPRGP